MNKTKLATEIVDEHTKKGVSTLSQKKLGELLHHRHPDLFTDKEDGRWFVRKVLQKAGKKKNAYVKPELKREWNGFKLPEPEKNDYSKVIINQKRIGVLSDIHFPYYDKAALNAAVKYLIKWKPDCIILNGDIVDMYQASSFERDPRQRSIKYELDMVRDWLTQLQNLFPKTRIIYKFGNHSERYEKKILQRLPEFIDLEWMTLDAALNFGRAKKIEIVKNKRVIRAGKLNILHAHELPKGMAGPVNPARGFYLKTKASTLGGHHHQSSEHIESDLNGNIIGCWSTGCLCELNPAYAPINRWNHGFATVEVLNKEGDFNVNNIKIINGKIL